MGGGGRPPADALFHNVEGSFVDVSDDSGADVAMQGNGCVAADFDLDGHTDLYVTGAQDAWALAERYYAGDARS